MIEFQALLSFTCFAIATTDGQLVSIQTCTEHVQALISALLKSETQTTKIFHAKNQTRIYHDMVSQLHNVLLFVQQKIRQSGPVKPEELKLIEQELSLVMQLIRGHFNYQHRHIPKQSEVLPFIKMRPVLEFMVNNLLTVHQVQVKIRYLGKLQDAVRMASDDCAIHYGPLHRILLNLLLNIAEVKSREVELIFDYNDEGLKILLKNKILQLKDQKQLDNKLAQIILAPENKRPVGEAGEGLASVAELCEHLGGSFDFHISGDFWISQVFLPTPHLESEIQDPRKVA